jgi:hypothetical protein
MESAWKGKRRKFEGIEPEIKRRWGKKINFKLSSNQ